MKKYVFLISFLALNQWASAQYQNSEGWSLKFHFGFSRNNYQPTEIKLESTPLTTTLDTDFVERTSAHWYNPFKKDRQIDEIFKWIDEPTNAMTISLENEKMRFT